MPNSTTKNYAWSFLEQGGSKLVAIIVQIILARLLAPEAFGIMAILLVVINVGSAIAQNGITVALIQFEPISERTYSTAFWLSFVFACILYASIFAIAPLLAGFYEIDTLDFYIRTLSLILIINALGSVQRVQLQRHLDLKSLCIANILATIVSGVTAIICAMMGMGIWALILYTILQSIITCIILTVFTRWVPSLEFDAIAAKSVFSFGWKICISNILNTLCSGLPETILGKTTSTTSLGYYSQGIKWPTTIMAAFSAAVENVIYPTFSRLKHDIEALHSSMKSHLINGSAVIMPICILAALIAEPLTMALLTDKWLPSVPIFQLSSLSFFFVIPQIVNLRAYLALGDSGIYMKTNIAKITIGLIVLGATAIFVRDIYAMAFASFCYMTFSILLIDMQPAKRVTGLAREIQLKLVLPVASLAIVSAFLPACVGLLDFNYIAKMILQILIYGGIYIAGLYLFRIGNILDIAKAFFKQR